MDTQGNIVKTFPLTEHEEHYRTNPDDVDGIVFKTRQVKGRAVRYSPLHATNVFALGHTPLFSIKRHSRFLRFPEHCHDGIELNYQYAGSCTQVINGRRVTLLAGQTLLLSPDTVHTIEPLGEQDILINLNINQDYLLTGLLSRLSCESLVTQMLVDSLRGSFGSDAYLFVPSQNNHHLRTYLHCLLDEWTRPGTMARDVTENLFALVVAEVIASYQASCEEGDGGPIGSALPIVQYLELNYATCTLERTAEEFHLHPTYLSAMLKERVGYTYRELVQKLRLDAAARLLASTKLSVTEVARAVGYENVTHFYRIFERRHSCTPGAWRRQERL